MDLKRPQILYKYANWNNDHHKRIITHNELYFASAKLFNDPFDSDIPLRYDLRSVEENLTIIKQFVKRDHPRWNDEAINSEAAIILAQRNWEKEENKKAAEDLRIKFMFHQKRILSLSGVKDNILLWSHYANSHRGFCIAIDIEQIDEYFEKYNNETNCPAILYKVKYSHQLPILIPGPDFNDSSVVIDALTTKAENWAYECEWRYIMTLPEALMSKEHCIINLPDGIISEIILGCRMAEFDKDEIIKIIKAKERRPKLFAAKRSKDSFSLDIEEILL
jgi:hypothetical protein